MRLPLLVLVACALLAAGCGGGPPTTQTRDVGSFSQINVIGDIDVDVAPGADGTVKVTAGKKVIDRVVTETKGGILNVRIRDHGIVIGSDPFNDVHIEASSDALNTIQITGSSDVKLGRVDHHQFAVEVNGSGDIEATGTVENLIMSIEGSGDAHLFDLHARTANVTLEGDGDAELSVSDRLNVRIAGSGDVRYRGHPVVQQSVAGDGDITPAD
jgi:putative autotransporter adhesin-like protein